MTSFMVEIITPEGKLFSGECLQVDVPGSEGRMGILAAHMNFVSSLIPGLVEISLNDNATKKLVVADGIVEVNSGKCVILVEQASNPIAKVAAKKAAEIAKKKADEKVVKIINDAEARCKQSLEDAKVKADAKAAESKK